MKGVIYISIMVVLVITTIDYFDVMLFQQSYYWSQVAEGFAFGICVLSVSIVFIGVLLHFLPKRCFVAWWKFARFAIPAVLGLMVWSNLEFSQRSSGFFSIINSSVVNLVVVSLLVFIFGIASLTLIVRGYNTKLTKKSVRKEFVY